VELLLNPNFVEVLRELSATETDFLIDITVCRQGVPADTLERLPQ